MSGRAGAEGPLRAISAPRLSRSPLSAAMVVGDLVFTSGQVGRDPQGQKVQADFAGQFRQAVANLEQVLQQAGSTLQAVAKVTVYLVDRGDFAALNDLYTGAFAEPYPARSTVIVAGLAQPDLLVELEAVAVRSPAAPPENAA